MSDGIRDSFTPGTPYGSDYLAPPTGPMPDRSLASTPADDAPFLAGGGGSGAPKENSYSTSDDVLFPTRPLYKRPWFWLATAAGLAVVVLAVVLPVYFVVIKPDRDHHSTSSGASSTSSSGSSGDSGTSGNSGTTGSSNPQTLTTGGDGSTVTTDDGTTFTYKNPFGGYCECPSLLCPSSSLPPRFVDDRSKMVRAERGNMGAYMPFARMGQIPPCVGCGGGADGGTRSFWSSHGCAILSFRRGGLLGAMGGISGEKEDTRDGARREPRVLTRSRCVPRGLTTFRHRGLQPTESV